MAYSNITDALEDIIAASYGKDVRQAIHDGIRICYNEGHAGTTDLYSREEIEKLKVVIDKIIYGDATEELTNLLDTINGEVI